MVFPDALGSDAPHSSGRGTGKTHFGDALARAWIRNGARGQFYNVVDLVNRLHDEQHAGRCRKTLPTDTPAPDRSDAAAQLRGD